MTLQDMYKGIANSPMTELAHDVDSNQTTIEIVEGSALPDAPNLATIGIGEDAETIKYDNKNGNTLSGVTRGFQGTAKSWIAGIVISRMFTAYDYDTLIDNIENVDSKADGAIKESEKGAVGGVAKQDDFVEHKAERATLEKLGHVKPDGTTITIDAGGKISANLPEPTSFRGILANNANTQSVANASFLTIGSVIYDTDTFFSSANPTRLTIPNGVKKVRINASVQFGANGNGYRSLNIRVNGAFPVGVPVSTVPTASVETDISITSAIIDVKAGDYIEVQASHSAGVSIGLMLRFFSIEVIE